MLHNYSYLEAAQGNKTKNVKVMQIIFAFATRPILDNARFLVNDIKVG